MFGFRENSGKANLTSSRIPLQNATTPSFHINVLYDKSRRMSCLYKFFFKDQLGAGSSSPSSMASTRGSRSPGTRQLEQPFHVQAVEVPRFDPDDPHMPLYLEEHGYVVIRNVASPEEVNRATDLLWAFLSKTAGMQHDDPTTWSDERFCKVGSITSGILFNQGVGQSDFLWYLRLLPRVKAAFQSIFNEADLICSFDGGSVFRPWHAPGASPECKTNGGWFHVDQGRSLKGRCAVQGLVTLTDASADTGGFCVIPGSHKHHERLIEQSRLRSDANFVHVSPDFDVLGHPQILPLCRAGDLVLWDSRTIHCNTPSLVQRPAIPADRLLRAAGYVCMVPTAWASPEVLRIRRDVFELGQTRNHWPQFMECSGGTEGRIKAHHLDDAAPKQRSLIIGDINLQF